MEDGVIICRCEDVTWGDIMRALEKGWTSIEEIKRITRAGMGRCQGLICRNMLIKETAKACDKNVEDVFPIPTFRSPIKPLRLSIIAGDKDD